MVNVTRTSPFSGKTNTRVINISETEFKVGLLRYAQGTYIQDAFPTLDADDREFIKTGITPEEWDETFGKDEE